MKTPFSKTKLLAPALGFALLGLTSSHAAIVANLDMTAGAQTIDTTSTAYTAWGYATTELISTPTWDNTKSGGAVLGMTQTGLSGGSRDYGHTFTFNDGTSPTSGTTVATDGNLTSLALGDSVQFTFSNIVSTTEQTLTLYLGTFQSGRAAVNLTSNLTGGTADDTSSTAFYDFEAGTVAGTYTVTFSSATETDLVIDAVIATPSGGFTGTRNIGFSGYTLTAVPEPSSAALVGGLGLLALLRRRR